MRKTPWHQRIRGKVAGALIRAAIRIAPPISVEIQADNGESGEDAGEDFADEFRAYPCVECGEEVPARECYTDSGEVIHAIGVTGQAEPHETGNREPSR